MSYSYDIVSAAPVGLGITPRQPLKELNHNVAQVDTESSTLTPELERAIRDMNTAQARGKLITLCKKYPSVCQELHKTVLGKSAPAKKKTVPQVRMAKCIQCNNQFDTMRNNTPACVWHTDIKVVDEVAEEWMDQKWGDPEPREFINDPVYQNGFIWQCCEKKGHVKGCQRTYHMTKEDHSANTQKRKAEEEIQRPQVAGGIVAAPAKRQSLGTPTAPVPKPVVKATKPKARPIYETEKKEVFDMMGHLTPAYLANMRAERAKREAEGNPKPNVFEHHRSCANCRVFFDTKDSVSNGPQSCVFHPGQTVKDIRNAGTPWDYVLWNCCLVPADGRSRGCRTSSHSLVKFPGYENPQAVQGIGS